MIGTIIIFLLIFFVIVMGHEFGHFLIAKVNGIRVNEFAIGMGPKIAGFKKGETEYVLRAFPLGGACIFEGEDGLEAAKEEASAAGTPADKTGRGALRNVPVDVDRGNFQNAPVWSRIATVFAGPLFNFLLAFIFAIMVAGYAGADLPVLGSVVEGSAAEAAGMQAGDKILERINGAAVGIQEAAHDNAQEQRRIHFLGDQSQDDGRHRREQGCDGAPDKAGMLHVALGKCCCHQDTCKRENDQQELAEPFHTW